MENDNMEAADLLMPSSESVSPDSLSPVSDGPILVTTDDDDENVIVVDFTINSATKSPPPPPPPTPTPPPPPTLTDYTITAANANGGGTSLRVNNPIQLEYHHRNLNQQQHYHLHQRKEPRYDYYEQADRFMSYARANNFQFGNLVNSSPSVLSSATHSNNNKTSNRGTGTAPQQSLEEAYLQHQLHQYMCLQTLFARSSESSSAHQQQQNSKKKSARRSLKTTATPTPPPPAAAPSTTTTPPPSLPPPPLPSPTSIFSGAPKIVCRNCAPSEGFYLSTSMRHSFIQQRLQQENRPIPPDEFCCRDAYIYSVAPWRRNTNKNLDPDGSILKETIADNNAIIQKFNELCVSNPNNFGYSTVHVRQALEYDQQQQQQQAQGSRANPYMYYNENSASNKGYASGYSGSGNANGSTTANSSNSSNKNNANNNTGDNNFNNRDQKPSSNAGVGAVGGGGGERSSVSYPQGMWAEVGRRSNDNNAAVTQLIHNAVRAGLTAGAAAMNNMQQQQNNLQHRRAHTELSMAPATHSSLVKRSVQGEFLLKLQQLNKNSEPPLEVLHQRSPRHHHHHHYNDLKVENINQKSPRHQQHIDSPDSPKRKQQQRQQSDPPVEVLHQKSLQPTGSSEALLEETKRQMNEIRRTSLTRPFSSPAGGNRKMNEDLQRDWDYRQFNNLVSQKHRGQHQGTVHTNEESYNNHIFGVRRDYVEGRHFADHESARDNFFSQHNRTTSLININLRPVNLATPPCAAPRPKKPVMGMSNKK